ncbi:MAG: aminotransferase class V-fold PLP-dependent enzyme [Lachnospiraceae bacterium]|jgi:arginine decarboxylase|nr:aminotransferase class V-fold PLP-dependent enzyme [Lachnospiraceae bacterium]
MPSNIFYTLQKSSYLDHKLQAYADSDYYPFHMPGHKRTDKLEFPNPYSMDITEIEGFDNLHHPEGILKEAQMRASELFGSKASFYLINGSTSGILSAISAALPPRGALLMSRNSHKSAYHAAYLRELNTIYLMPAATEFGISGSISPASVEQALQENPGIGAVFITSPTYDGIVSDIQAIAGIAHSHNLPLIVDEAHGAHFMFSRKFPSPALRCGADIAIQSLHKTLPCLTQCALLHVNSKRIGLSLIKRFLDIYQTSSPSYLLMSSIEQCLRFLREESVSQMAEYTQILQAFYRKSENLRHLKVFHKSSCPPELCFDHDFSKILISVGSTGLTGKELYDALLHTYHLQLEMASGHYATALTSVMDTKAGFQRLAAALEDIDHKNRFNEAGGKGEPLSSDLIYQAPKHGMAIGEAMAQKTETLPLKASTGYISQEYIYLYPPGIPLVAPGEIMTGKLLRTISQCQAQGLSVEGLNDMSGKQINVVKM